MILEELRIRAAELFPLAVTAAVEQPDAKNAALDTLRALCWEHYKILGFRCMGDCFDEVVPRTDGHLTLECWSSAEMKVMPWTLRVTCRPFYLSTTSTHIEIKHNGPLPGVTETGYRSIFVPMTAFAKIGPEEFIRKQLCRDLPDSVQMTLF